MTRGGKCGAGFFRVALRCATWIFIGVEIKRLELPIFLNCSLFLEVITGKVLGPYMSIKDPYKKEYQWTLNNGDYMESGPMHTLEVPQFDYLFDIELSQFNLIFKKNNLSLTG